VKGLCVENLLLGLLLIDRNVVDVLPTDGSSLLKALCRDNERISDLPTLRHQPELALVVQEVDLVLLQLHR